MKSRWEWRIKNPINLDFSSKVMSLFLDSPVPGSNLGPGPVKTSKQINRALVIRPTQTI